MNKRELEQRLREVERKNRDLDNRFRELRAGFDVVTAAPKKRADIPALVWGRLYDKPNYGIRLLPGLVLETVRDLYYEGVVSRDDVLWYVGLEENND